ncbi:MAG: DUF1015 domain-containing protein [Phycisphaerae bacterium]
MEIRPFRGWRYSGGLDGDISPYIAPPYDILSPADKQRLLAGSKSNVVAVDLPHVPAKELGPEGAYTAAGERFEQWKASGVIRQDAEPSIYVYEQTYTWAGRTYARQAMICGVRATELGEGVIPHEHVFPGPLADRLRLTQATRTQLSPIFGFYDDPGGSVSGLLTAAAGQRPVARGELRDVVERLWRIRDGGTIDAIASALREAPVFIADGHHRYTTARNYCKLLTEAGRLDDGHEANFVMFALVARDNPGLLILPTHRLFSNLSETATMEKLAEALPEFSWRPSGGADIGVAAIEALLGCAPPGAMAFVAGRSADLWVVELTRPEAMRQAAPEQSEEWRSLPPAILHELIMEKALNPWANGELSVEYTPDVGEVVEACRSGRAQLGVILQSIGVRSVEAIALSGASMPHKSTYFYPKIATGMVFKPLE